MRSFILTFKQNSRISEFETFFNRTVACVERHNPEQLKIKELSDALASKLLNDGFNNPIRKMPLTTEQLALVGELDKAIRLFSNYMSIRERQHKLGYKQELEFDASIAYYLKSYYKLNVYMKLGKVKKMLETIDTLKTTDKLELDAMTNEWIDKIRTIYLELQDVYDERMKYRANMTKGKNVNLKRDLELMLREFFSSLMLTAMANKSINYSPLLNELSEEVKRFNAASKPKSTVKTDANASNRPEPLSAGAMKNE